METKVCSRCGETKPIADYRVYKRGVASYCRRCLNDQCAAYREKNSTTVKETIRKWQKANPDRTKEAVARWRSRQPAGALAEEQKLRREKDVERARKRDRDWYSVNVENVKARKSVEKKAAYHKDIEATRAARRVRYAANKDYYKSLVHGYRARKAGFTGRYSQDDLASILKAQRGKCAYCKRPLGMDFEIDHITPIFKGGSNHRRNIQLTCEHCNRSKNSLDPLDYARRLGRLL